MAKSFFFRHHFYLFRPFDVNDASIELGARVQQARKSIDVKLNHLRMLSCMRTRAHG